MIDYFKAIVIVHETDICRVLWATPSGIKHIEFDTLGL